uniref:Uncharacterized protein n=1 Tax=Aegilops tauschii TaxID=37682 RepID=M8B0G3_AEGTA
MEYPAPCLSRRSGSSWLPRRMATVSSSSFGSHSHSSSAWTPLSSGERTPLAALKAEPQEMQTNRQAVVKGNEIVATEYRIIVTRSQAVGFPPAAGTTGGCHATSPPNIMPCKLKALRCVASDCLPQEVEVRKWMNGYHIIRSFPNDRHWKTNAKSNGYLLQQGPNVRCHSYGSRSGSETTECNIPEDGNNPYRDFDEHRRGMSHFSDSQVAAQEKTLYSTQGLSKACQFVYNDAKFVNERAQSDILLLSRGITRLNKRASKDVAVLGLGFLKLDDCLKARARKDTRKIDNSVKEQAAHLTNFARILKERAHSDLKKAADQHWSDGALEVGLYC